MELSHSAAIARDQLWQRPLLAGLQPAESKEVFIDC